MSEDGKRMCANDGKGTPRLMMLECRWITQEEEREDGEKRLICEKLCVKNNTGNMKNEI